MLKRNMVRALTVSLAAALGALATGAGDVAWAHDVCPGYYVTMFKSSFFGQHTGEGIYNFNEDRLNMNTRDAAHSFVAFGGVTRPRRTAVFRFTNEQGYITFTGRNGLPTINYETSAAEDNGVIRQESNVLPWTGDLARPGQRLNVYADFSHRCGGDDVRANNVLVGTVFTYPSVPVEHNPKFVVLDVAYSPPGRQSTVNYGESTTVGSRFSFTNSFQGGVTVTNSHQTDVNRTITTSAGFTQRATIGGSDAIEKAQSSNLIIPGPAIPIETIPHDFDLFEIWLNARFSVTSTSPFAVETSGFSVDPRDPVPGMDIVRLSVQELKNPGLIPAGTQARLERSWSPTGALTTEDFNAILAHNPFANGSTAIDPVRFTLVDGVNFDFRPAEPGGQPLTQQFGVRVTASSSSSQAFTTTIKTDRTVETSTTTVPNPTLVIDEQTEKLKSTHKVNSSVEVSLSQNLDQTNTATQSTNVSITGPSTGYQGPTALRLYQDNLFGTIMFAFAPVPTFQIGVTNPTQTVLQGSTASYPITTQGDFGFANAITFEPSVMGLPAGATASFSPTSTTPPGASTLTVTTTAQTPPGTYPLTFTATSGLIRRHTTVTLVVGPLPFTLTATPATRSVASGETTTYTVNVNAIPGFAGPVTLSGPSGLPPGTTATFNPRIVNGGSGTSTLTVTTSPSTPTRTSTLTITGTGTTTSGPVTQRTTVSLVTDANQDFGLNVTPEAAGIGVGETAEYTVATTAINGFGGNVNLTASGLPPGATPTFTVNPITGAGSSTLRIATTSSTPPGDYEITVTGTAGSRIHSQTVGLSVSDFALASAPGARAAMPGESTTFAISTAPVNDHTDNIGLSVSGLPPGATGSFNASPVSPGSGSTLSVYVHSTTPAGDYPLTITGTSGGVSHTETVWLDVMSSEPGLTLTLGQDAMTVGRGSAGIVSIDTYGVGTFVYLSVDGLPNGVTVSFDANPTTVFATTYMYLVAGSSAPPGTYTITVTGTDGNYDDSRALLLTVT